MPELAQPLGHRGLEHHLIAALLFLAQARAAGALHRGCFLTRPPSLSLTQQELPTIFSVAHFAMIADPPLSFLMSIDHASPPTHSAFQMTPPLSSIPW